ncbi:MAG: hypothetical protein ACLQOQ_20765 [Beijerinckiaceae bacterium]
MNDLLEVIMGSMGKYIEYLNHIECGKIGDDLYTAKSVRQADNGTKITAETDGFFRNPAYALATGEPSTVLTGKVTVEGADKPIPIAGINLGEDGAAGAAAEIGRQDLRTCIAKLGPSF